MKAKQKNYNVWSAIVNHTGKDVSFSDVEVLRRASMTLRRWFEAECNGEIQRDEETGKPFRYYGIYMQHKSPTADREKGAMARIQEVCERNGLYYFIQGDPRGCALYVHKEPMAYNNYTIGVAVCD